MKNKIKKSGINILLFLIVVLISLVILESCLQYNALTMYDKELGYRLKPNSERRIINQIIKTNSDGLRDKEYDKKGNNTFRILILGDSYTFGLGNKLEDTYVKLLEKKLNSFNPDVNFEVINAGIFGYGTYHEAYLFDKIKNKYNPDIVILQYYLNDIHDNFIVYQSIYERFKLLVLLRTLKLRIKLKDSISYLYYRHPTDLLSKNYSKQYMGWWNLTEKAILYTEKRAKSVNSSFAIVIIPSWGQIYFNYTYAKDKPFLTPEIIKKIKEDMLNLELYGDLDKPNKLLKNFGEEYDIKIIDPIKEFRKHTLKNENIYQLPYDDHLNSQGNEILAEFIFRRLNEDQLIPDKNQ